MTIFVICVGSSLLSKATDVTLLKSSHISLRYLTQTMLCKSTQFRVRGPPIDKSGASRIRGDMLSFYSLGIEGHDKISLYLVNKHCFA